MRVTVECPFCLSSQSVVVPEAGSANAALARVVCERCGESFVPTVPTEMADSPVHPDSVTPATTAQMLRPLFYLGAMLGIVVLAIGLYGIFRGQPERRQVDPASVPVVRGLPVPGAEANAWPELGYLPADAGIVVAFDMLALDREAARTNDTPRGLLTGLGVPNEVFQTLDPLGLSPDQLSQVALSLSFTDASAVPRLVAVVQTRKPIDVADWKRRLGAKSLEALAGRPRFQVTIRSFPLEWLEVDERTHLFVSDGADLATVQRRTLLRDRLRQALTHLDAKSLGFVVTEEADWHRRPTVELALRLAGRSDLLSRLAGVKSLAAGVAFQPDAQMTLALQATTENELARLTAEAKTAATGLPVELAPQDGWLTAKTPLDARLGRTVTAEWLRRLTVKR